MKQRLFLTFDKAALDTPILANMTNHFRVMFNIFGATVNETTQFIALELEGDDDQVRAAMDYLRQQGVQIETSQKSARKGDGLA